MLPWATFILLLFALASWAPIPQCCSLAIVFDLWFATSAIIDLGVDVSRTVVYYFNGYIKIELLYLIPILIVVGILGTWIGKLILNKMSQEQFRYIVLFLILGIGLASIISNL